MDLQAYVVTVRCFDPGRPDELGTVHELPVDCIDPEHAVAAAISNAVAFTPKTSDDLEVLPVAFAAVAVTLRSG